MRMRSLHYFAVLAEELHYGRAAQRLCITQPPLSASIKALEEELGLQLFVRTSRDVKLTPAGEAYQVEVRKILEGIERAARVAKAANQGAAGNLSIGFGVSLIYRGIMEIVKDFSKRYPKIDIEMIELPQSETLDKLLHGQIDLAFTSTPSVPDGLASLPLPADEFAVCIPAGHPLAQEAEVDLKSLAAEPFVMFDPEIGPLNYQTISAIFHEAGVYPRLVHKTRNWLAMVALVSAGCGVALLPFSLARAGMEGVRFVPIKGPRTLAMAKLVWNAHNDDPLVKSFTIFSASLLGHRQGAKET